MRILQAMCLLGAVGSFFVYPPLGIGLLVVLFILLSVSTSSYWARQRSAQSLENIERKLRRR